MKSIHDIKVGDSASLKKVATNDVIISLAEISGDYNPVHLDNSYAQNTVFRKRIAHALFCLGMISNLIGNNLPGEGAIFLNENINYRAPVYVNDEIEAIVKVVEIIPLKDIIIMELRCVNQNGITVLDGTTSVKIM